MKKILLLGPFPIGDKGLNGQTISNKMLYEGLLESYNINKINTLKSFEFVNKTEQGKFCIGKFLKILLYLIGDVFQIMFVKYDIIYMTPGQSFLGFIRFSPYMILSFMKKTPCYIHIHGSNFKNMYNKQLYIQRKILDYFLKRVAGVIVLGKYLVNTFEGLIEDSKIFTCENGVEDEIVASKKEIEKKLERIKKTNKRKVLFLSNLMKEKGILDVLEASEKFKEYEIEFNLAGAIEPNIKNIIENYLRKYPNKIIYHGVVSGKKKKKLLLDNDILILPSWDEGQPIAILEAYVTGCSVITDPNIGGIRDIYKNKINGISCQIKKPDTIEKAINILKNEYQYTEFNYKIGYLNYTREQFIKRIKLILGES